MRYKQPLCVSWTVCRERNEHTLHMSQVSHWTILWNRYQLFVNFTFCWKGDWSFLLINHSFLWYFTYKEYLQILQDIIFSNVNYRCIVVLQYNDITLTSCTWIPQNCFLLKTVFSSRTEHTYCLDITIYIFSKLPMNQRLCDCNLQNEYSETLGLDLYFQCFDRICGIFYKRCIISISDISEKKLFSDNSKQLIFTKESDY